LKRTWEDNASKTIAKKAKAGSKSLEKHGIARKEGTVAILATVNERIVVGYGIVMSDRTKHHGKTIGKIVAMANLIEVEDEHMIYKLPFPDMNDNPLQLLLRDAKGTTVLWRKKFSGPE
jgi:hypothetical protein